MACRGRIVLPVAFAFTTRTVPPNAERELTACALSPLNTLDKIGIGQQEASRILKDHAGERAN